MSDLASDIVHCLSFAVTKVIMLVLIHSLQTP
jgi:hypothetical protein